MVDFAATPVEAAKEANGLLDRELVRELRFLQLDPQPLAQGIIASASPSPAKHLYNSVVGKRQALKHFYSRSFACAVWAKQPKAFAAPDLEIQAVDGGNVVEPLYQTLAPGSSLISVTCTIRSLAHHF
jgi:hypothetical protein